MALTTYFNFSFVNEAINNLNEWQQKAHKYIQVIFFDKMNTKSMKSH